jgi:hypothetical protein
VEGFVPGDEDHRPVLPTPGEGRRTRNDVGKSRGDNAAERAQPAGAQGRGRFLHVPIHSLQHRLQGAHHERQPDEDQCHDHAQGRISHVQS